MPELPEVETVCSYICKTFKGEEIVSAEVFRFDLRIGTSVPQDFIKRVTGTKITDVCRRGKYILVHLSSEEIMTVHLGMTGRFIVHDSSYKKAKHDHIILHFKGGKCLVFSDARRFGMVDLAPAKIALERLAFMGAEPLSDDFNPASFLQKIKGRKVPIKQALLNQEIVAGLGNIYVCEALFEAGISPLHAAEKITLQEAEKLVPIIKNILQKSIAAGGTTFRDYRSAEGKKGAFVNSLLVYGKEGEKCVNCGHKIVKIMQGGRGTFFCEKCQK
jgi:formamidopyrimidine-DNA glycosylase (fpg)